MMNSGFDLDDNYNLIDVYCKGPRYNQPYIFTPFATWNQTHGFQLTYKFPPQYSLEYRGDLSNMTLKGVTTINRPKILPSDVDGILTKTGIDEGVSQLTKYHYALNKILMSKYLFNVTYRVSRSWTGYMKNGYRLGVFGIVARNEVDIVGTGSYRRLKRFDLFDSLHESYKFE